MRLLLLTPQLPFPPHQGTTIRNYNLVRHLSKRHEVHLLSFVLQAGEEVASPLREACQSLRTVVAPQRSTRQRVAGLLTSGLPDMALRLPSAEFHAVLRETLGRQAFDVVQVEGIEMAQYGLAWCGDQPSGRQSRQRPMNSPLWVFDDHNAEYVLQRRAFETDVRRPRRWLAAAYSWVQWRRLTAYECLACRHMDRVVVCSEADRFALQAIMPGLEPAVIPNGVDSAYYHPDAVPDHTPLPPHSLVFTGKMDFRPNIDAVVWFVQEVWPNLKAKVPDARFYIVGQRPHSRVSSLADAAGVTVTGTVEDVRPYMAGADVYVVPLRIGGGTRLKVLEAMAMGRPMVSTTLGCEGFPVTSGRQLVMADEPSEFAAACVDLLLHREKGIVLGREARRFVECHYDWASIVPQFDRVYESR
jgi:glycosyltransferase involved in cell wall biosynthesis